MRNILSLKYYITRHVQQRNILTDLLAFILLPQGLWALYAIVSLIKDRTGCWTALLRLFLAQLFPLIVPASSIYLAARELFWGEDREDDLNMMKGLKMFEHLGEFLFRIL